MNLIPYDYTRCANDKCTKKTICKRFLQMEIDLSKQTINPISIVKFNAENCEKIIRK